MEWKSLFVALALLGWTAAPALADPFKITRDSIVEGSIRQGGIQPDYLISPRQDPMLARVLKFAERIGQKDIDYWTKVSRVRKMVHSYLRHGDYYDPKYRNLCSIYRKKGEPIPLGEYLRAKAGVCRENYLTLHLALRSAGIENEAIYAKTEQYSRGKRHVEDHGFVVLRGGPGDGLTVDSYNKTFNGQRLDELTKKEEGNLRRVISIYNFPVVRPLEEAAPSQAAPGH